MKTLVKTSHRGAQGTDLPAGASGNRRCTGNRDTSGGSTNGGAHRQRNAPRSGAPRRTCDLRMPPTPAWPYPHPQARRPHSYLGHCTLLWAPRSQRRVRLEGSERRVRSEVARAAGGRAEGSVARGQGQRRARAQQGGPTVALLATCPPCPNSPCPGTDAPSTPAAPGHLQHLDNNGVTEGGKQVLPTPERPWASDWPLVPGSQDPGAEVLAAEVGLLPRLTCWMQSQASRACRGPGQRLPSAFTAPWAPDSPTSLLPSRPRAEIPPPPPATQGSLCGCWAPCKALHTHLSRHPQPPLRWGQSSHSFANEETEARRGHITCPRPHCMGQEGTDLASCAPNHWAS